jgi:dipeptidyl aminopeptidase/acylaminoacyl peptidase
VTRVEPYGTWPSQIGADLVSVASVGFSLTRLDGGAVWWLESRPAEAGRVVLVRGTADAGPVDVSPEGFNIRSTVHEYGGGAALVAGGVAYCSNLEDQRVYRLERDAREPVPITPDSGGRDRYADARLTPDGRWLLCVRERHPDPDDPAGVRNELAALSADGMTEPRTIRSGRDFYSTPRISPDGSKLCWLEWDHPWMPWDGCELMLGDLGHDGTIGEVALAAGRVGEESIFQPSWSPTGDLHFASDRTGWWNLYREHDGEQQALHLAEAEFGWPQWLFGTSTHSFLGDGRIACLWSRDGVQHVAILDPGTGELIDLDLPYTAMWPWLDAEGDLVTFVGGGPAIPDQVVLLDVTARSVEVLRSSGAADLDERDISAPRQIAFPTDGGATAFAHHYPPRNRDVVGPDGERPPLIVMSHGGPTAQATARLSLEKQFWTSRGFAVVDVNYGGSTGFGRAYRRRLNGNWGVVDTADCIAAARWLANEGDVDGSRLLITGSSAGGYTTLCALTMHDVFAAGTSYFGLADLESFATGGTHKFESWYLTSLVGPYPEDAERYRERSPIHATDGISCPMLLLQGARDRVVPPAQAEIMVEALRRKGLPYAYVLFEDEDHGFRDAAAIRGALEAELSFYAQVLGFSRDDVPLLALENV